MSALANLLQIASASSEPSAHSASPSQRHLPGRHWPLLQVKSVDAHVFFPEEEGRNKTSDQKKEGLSGTIFIATTIHVEVNLSLNI